MADAAAGRPRREQGEPSWLEDEDTMWSEAFWMLQEGGDSARASHYALAACSLKRKGEDIQQQLDALRLAEASILQAAQDDVGEALAGLAEPRERHPTKQARTWGVCLAEAVEQQTRQAAVRLAREAPPYAATELAQEAQEEVGELLAAHGEAEAEVQAQAVAMAEEALMMQAEAVAQAQAASESQAQQRQQRPQAVASVVVAPPPPQVVRPPSLNVNAVGRPGQAQLPATLQAPSQAASAAAVPPAAAGSLLPPRPPPAAAATGAAGLARTTEQEVQQQLLALLSQRAELQAAFSSLQGGQS